MNMSSVEYIVQRESEDYESNLSPKTKGSEENEVKKPEFKRERDMIMTDNVKNLNLDGPNPKLSPNPYPNRNLSQPPGLQQQYCKSPLMWAVNSGLLSAVNKLLNSFNDDPEIPIGGDLFGCDSVGRGPLHECAALVHSSNSIEVAMIAETLISAGAQVNETSVSGRTALHELYCKTQDETVSCYSISFKGATSMFTQTIPSSVAVVKNRKQMTRSLLQFGANPLLLDRHGLAPIHYCAREDYADCMLEILRADSDGSFKSRQGQSPLHIACKAGAVKVITLLCRWDADSVPLRASITQQQDQRGKLSLNLIGSLSSNCLETLWGSCRAGDVTRTSKIIIKMRSYDKEGQALWEEVEESNASLHELATTLEMTKVTETINKPDVSDRKTENKRNSNRVRLSSGGNELWLVDGIDSKSRRLRWTALHACIIGWAELKASTYLSNKTRKSDWNEGRKHTTKSLNSEESSRVSDVLCIALGLLPLSLSPHSMAQRGPARVSMSHKDTLSLILKCHAFVDSLEINCRTPLHVAAICNLTEACSILLDAG
jgi:ankyrin repeat protein